MAATKATKQAQTRKRNRETREYVSKLSTRQLDALLSGFSAYELERLESSLKRIRERVTQQEIAKTRTMIAKLEEKLEQLEQ